MIGLTEITSEKTETMTGIIGIIEIMTRITEMVTENDEIKTGTT